MCRASLAMYNTTEEVDRLVAGLQRIRKLLGVKDGTMAALPDKDKLLRNFSRCANWEEKYLYIIELGQRLAPLSPEEHSGAEHYSGLSKPGLDRDGPGSHRRDHPARR